MKLSFVTSVYYNDEEYKPIYCMMPWKEEKFKSSFHQPDKEKKRPKILFYNFYLFLAKKNIATSTCGCGCRSTSNCPLVGPGTIGGMPSVGVFQGLTQPFALELI